MKPGTAIEVPGSSAVPDTPMADRGEGRYEATLTMPVPGAWTVTATAIDPSSARAFQLLGEAYLLARKGTLGVAALNEAVRLDPIGMAECHLLMARLYDLAGVKPLASREYRLFLEKVPQHPEKKKLEKYIKDNPEEAGSK